MYTKKIEELTISNNFMFSKVMSDKRLLKELINRILPNININDMQIIIKEYTLKVDYLSHGIRFDVLAEDGSKVFDIEMQVAKGKKDLIRRSRYYHSIIDVNEVEKGNKYKDMKDSYVIFICDFDIFDDNMYMYTCNTRCNETNKEIIDGRTTIFLNAKGTKGNISKKLKNFMDYVGGRGKDMSDTFIKEVDGSVLRHRLSRETRIEFMSLRAELEDAYDEGERKGVEKGKELGIEIGEGIGEVNNAISNVKSLMKNLNCPIDEAIKVLNIKEDLIDAVKEAIE